MRKRPIAAAAAVVAAGLAIAGAAAPPAPSESTSVSAAVEEFVATGVLPTDVSGDPGIWNYAGPAGTCPGLGWICVTLGVVPVTQIGTVNVIECVGDSCVGSTQAGYANTFECEPAGDVTSSTNTAALQECVIVQGGEHNDAKCVQKKTTTPFMRQRCSITQTGRDNQGTIVQVIDQTAGALQGALQEAGVSQTATASKNQLQVDQEIKQTATVTTLTGGQDQDAYQVVGGPFEEGMPVTGAATQLGALGVAEVDNQAQIDQKQIQRGRGATLLRQNDGVTAPLFSAPEDCNPVDVFSPAEPNVCANLEQRAGSGDNQSQLAQAIDDEGASSLEADQQQGSLEGGIDGRVHQETSGSSSSNQANQSETQKLVAAPGSTQAQFGPGGCCGFGSRIGPGWEQIAQKALQEASEEDAEQLLTLFGTSNSTDGGCAIAHDAKNNSGETSESFSFEPCVLQVVATACTNAPPEDEIILLQETEACTTETFEFD